MINIIKLYTSHIIIDVSYNTSSQN